MDTQELKHRVQRDHDSPTTAISPDDDHKKDDDDDSATVDKRKKEEKRTALAKRGLKSLSLAVLLPLSVTLSTTYLFGSSRNGGYGKDTTPFWFPPIWLLHATCVASTCFMNLSAWLIWAEGGFHEKPAAFWLYLAQLGLTLAWSPVVLRVGATWVGLGLCAAMIANLVGCFRVVRPMNPVAADLVKASLAWAAVLSTINLKLAFM
ncbi:translocator protein homolog [Carica papaya]|uniref:translocator protein homolog n=1 Tax=Carica papaya TaxID=3649 RepID=UPI000B8D1BD1|nr:translocator protein homolog [Carica papaya]